MKISKITMSAILIISASINLFATTQFPDKIIYKEKKYDIYTNPLEYYFSKNPDRKPKNGLISTALWRGYIATFEIKDGSLLVEDIQIQVRDTSSRLYDIKLLSVINQVFPNEKQRKADWFTGFLIIPYGGLVKNIRKAYPLPYENYLLFEIDRGIIKNEKRFNYKQHEEFKDRQFSAFKKTSDYKNLKKGMKKSGTTDELIDSFLRTFVLKYTTKILADY